MQKNRLIMCLLSSTLLFNTSNINTKINPFQTAGQPIAKVDLSNINEMVKDDIHMDMMRIQNGQKTRIEELHEERLEIERKVQERLDAIEEQKKKAKEIEESNSVYCDFVLTYYSLLADECGGKADGITASGKQVSRGMVASPKVLKFGTKIVIEGNEYIVEDRGHEKYIKVNNDGSIRLDVFIPRLQGESDSQYSKRVNDLGVKRVSGYYIKE